MSKINVFQTILCRSSGTDFSQWVKVNVFQTISRRSSGTYFSPPDGGKIVSW